MNVLIIEDDRSIGKSLVQGFREAGHECEWAVSGDTGMQKARSMKADVIVLDLMLPGLDGREVLKQLREDGLLTPVVVLTALGSLEDRVAGLEYGADDYMVKPFAFAELLARVHAVCRRSTLRPAATMTSGPLELDLTVRRANVEGQSIDLTPTEFSIMELLMRYEGQVVTRKMLCRHVWGFEWDGPTNVIEVHMNRLRKKLDKVGERRIATVRGRGYMLSAVAENGEGTSDSESNLD